MSWFQVPEVTRDSKELMGSQEAGASPETLGPQAPVAHPLEMKVRGPRGIGASGSRALAPVARTPEVVGCCSDTSHACLF